MDCTNRRCLAEDYRFGRRRGCKPHAGDGAAGSDDGAAGSGTGRLGPYSEPERVGSGSGSGPERVGSGSGLESVGSGSGPGLKGRFLSC